MDNWNRDNEDCVNWERLPWQKQPPHKLHGKVDLTTALGLLFLSFGSIPSFVSLEDSNPTQLL